MSLLDRLTTLAGLGWGDTFRSVSSQKRAMQHLFAGISTMGRRTISRTISALGRADKDWSADYKLFSRSKWNPRQLTDPILKWGVPLTGDGPIPLALDDTKIKKVGRKIPSAGWHRDPMSPPFYTNLQWGVRYLQAALLIPHDPEAKVACRSLPVRFVAAPWVKKPGKKASDQDRALYRQKTREQNLSQTGRELLIELRAALDQHGSQKRTMIVAVDGSFCNKAFFSKPLDRICLFGPSAQRRPPVFPGRAWKCKNL
jgi:hypothetical protein